MQRPQLAAAALALSSSLVVLACDPAPIPEEVLVCSLERARLLGGFRIEAHSAESVRPRAGRDEETPGANLHLRLAGTVRTGLTKLTPSLQRGRSFLLNQGRWRRTFETRQAGNP